MPPTDPIVALGQALHLIFKGIALAEKGLEMNPSKEEERDLNATLIDLEAQRAEIQAKLDALIAKSRVVAGPTQEQVERIAELTAQVEAQTNASVTASASVALTSRVLALASEVAGAR